MLQDCLGCVVRSDMLISIDRQVHLGIIDHGISTFPNECCGILGGFHDKDGNLYLTEYKRGINLNQERAKDRYELNPLDIIAAQKEFSESDIVGFYHSHPDCAANASETDRSKAWADYLYLIMSIQDGKFDSYKGWLLDDNKQFHEVAIRKAIAFCSFK